MLSCIVSRVTLAGAEDTAALLEEGTTEDTATEELLDMTGALDCAGAEELTAGAEELTA